MIGFFVKKVNFAPDFNQSGFFIALHINLLQMKNLIFKFLAVAMMLSLGIISGCGEIPTPGGEDIATFSIKFKEVGTGYVDLEVSSPVDVEAAYRLAKASDNLSISSPSILFASGRRVSIKANQPLRITDDIQENTDYKLFIAAKLNADSYSDIYVIEFSTPDWEFSNMLTVVGVQPDGYKMQVTVPESVKKGNTAIRYNQCDLMMYNLQTKNSGVDDYFTLLYNAGKFLKEDYILEYSESVNWEESEVDVNGDGVVNEEDLTLRWNPISPGEPIVFVAGEFEWMEIPDGFPADQNYNVKGFDYPAGWEAGYYLPCIDSTKYWGHYTKTKSMNLIEVDVNSEIDAFWTGAFERKTFRTQVPEQLNAKVNIEAVDITPADATVVFTPEEGVHQYAYGILDDASYNMMLELCDNNEDYLQWAITSYFSMINFGTGVAAGDAELRLDGDIFYEGKVPANSRIHVLVTAMGNEYGTTQSFNYYTFNTGEKVMGAPIIEVTALEDESSPFLAAFNIKCTTADDPTRGAVKRCFYGANYKKDFILAANGNSSYFDLAQSQPFSKEEVDEINSPEGLTIKIPTIDGETTRLAVVGFNIENTPNDFNYKDILECPAVADLTTEYRPYKPYVASDLYETLKGDWTATALLSDGTQHSNRIRISGSIKEGDHYPSVLPDSVYSIYEELTKYTREEVDGSFELFKDAAAEYNTHRLEEQNCLLMEGWIDKDEYGRLDYYSPWDLFIDREYSGVDEKSMFSDFGPKLYLEVSAGDKLSITSDMLYMPPVTYSSIPYYLAAYNPKRTASEGNVMFYETYTKDEYVPLTFPVELSEDGNTLTIKAIKDTQNNEWYPTLIGMDNTSSTGYAMYSVYTVSEITLTRGWDGNETKTVATKAAASNYSKPAGEVPAFEYKSLTRFEKPVKKVVKKGRITTIEMVEERLARLNEAIKNSQK